MSQGRFSEFARRLGAELLSPESVSKLRRMNSRMRVLGTHWDSYREAWLRPIRDDGRPDRILDAGCGRGEVLSEFKRFGVPIDYHGFDLAVGDSSWEFRVTAIADLHRLPLKSESFDKIVCTEVLEHVDRPAAVVAEFARVLRPGGRLFIAVPFVWHLHQEPFDRYRFSRHVLQHLLDEAGLRADSIQSAGGYFTVLRYLLSHPTYTANWPEPWQKIASVPHRVYGLFDSVLGGPLFYALDQLDTAEKISVGYFVYATKPGPATSPVPDDAYQCPACRAADLIREADAWTCRGCHERFGVSSGVPNLTLDQSYKPVTTKIKHHHDG